MNNKEILSILQKIFREILEDDNLELKEETTMYEIRGWDSLEHIKLITEIGNAFNTKFSISEIVSIESISDFIDLIQKRL